MPDESIFQINIDTKEAKFSLDDLKNKLDDLNKQWKGVKVGTEEFKSLGKQLVETKGYIKELTQPIKIDTKPAEGSIDALKIKIKELKKERDAADDPKKISAYNKELDESNLKIKELSGNKGNGFFDKLTSSISAAIPGVQNLTSVFGGLDDAMLAIATNPITITVTALVVVGKALYDSFKNTMEGAQEIAGVFGEFKGVGSQLQQILAKIAAVLAAVLIPIIKVVTEVVSVFLEQINKLLPSFDKANKGSADFSKAMDKISEALQPLISYVTSLAGFIIKVLVVAFNEMTLPARLLVGVLEALYNKFKFVRDVVQIVTMTFKGLYAAASQVFVVLGDIADVVNDILTGNFKDVKKDIQKALQAGKDVAQAFLDGANGVKKPSVSDAFDDAEKVIEKAKQDQVELATQQAELDAKIAKAKLDVIKGVKGAKKDLDDAEKSQKKYNQAILANKKSIVDAYRVEANANKDNKEAKENLLAAEKDYQEALTTGYQEEIKIARAEKKLNKTKKDDIDGLKKAFITSTSTQQESFSKLNKNSVAYYQQDKDLLQKQLDYYEKNYKKFHISDAKYLETKLALEKELQDKTQKLREVSYKDAEAADEVAVLKAGKSIQGKYDAEKKLLDDKYAYEISADQLTDNQKLLIEAKHNDDLKKLLDDKVKAEADANDKILKDQVAVDEKKLKSTEDEIKAGTKRESDLVAAEQKLHDDKKTLLDQEQADAIAASDGTAQAISKINDDFADQQKQNQQDLSDALVDIKNKEADARIALEGKIEKAATDLVDVLGSNAILLKQISAASAIISTYEAIAKQLAAFAKFPIPGYAIAQAIATGAFGLLQVAKIESTKVPGGHGGGGSQPSTGGGSNTSTKPPTQFSSAQMFGIGGQQINNPSQVQQNSKIYVTEGDISRVQGKVGQIKRASVLGS